MIVPQSVPGRKRVDEAPATGDHVGAFRVGLVRLRR